MSEQWSVKSIGDCCDLFTGGTPSRARPEFFGGDIKWLVSGDVHRREIFDCEGRITEEGLTNSNARPLPVNSVVIALNGQGKTRATVALLRTKATCNQSLVAINPRDPSELMPEFLYLNLHSRYQGIRNMTGDGGNDRRGLNMPLIRKLLVPLPPLDEQQRIVRILDEAFDAIATAKANAERNLANAAALFESQRNVAFSRSPENWKRVRIDTACESIMDCVNKTAPKAEGPTPFKMIRTTNVRHGRLSLESVNYVTEETYRIWTRRELPQRGDILLTREAPMGEVGIIETDDSVF